MSLVMLGTGSCLCMPRLLETSADCKCTYFLQYEADKRRGLLEFWSLSYIGHWNYICGCYGTIVQTEMELAARRTVTDPSGEVNVIEVEQDEKHEHLRERDPRAIRNHGGISRQEAATIRKKEAPTCAGMRICTGKRMRSFADSRYLLISRTAQIEANWERHETGGITNRKGNKNCIELRDARDTCVENALLKRGRPGYREEGNTSRALVLVLAQKGDWLAA
ncbi:hypothetical protein B0H17DRAFT_1138332 [Mycena rosella]|uniref:Uncharacterized protein n=1 Tax=Mycena rosella TaxID=1033263 RepID=A0AAD7D6V8_MYCRO|nr:hypothetical protein B0H17DRAFT_1138332 [Mycena rosella]